MNCFTHRPPSGWCSVPSSTSVIDTSVRVMRVVRPGTNPCHHARQLSPAAPAVVADHHKTMQFTFLTPIPCHSFPKYNEIETMFDTEPCFVLFLEKFMGSRCRSEISSLNNAVSCPRLASRAISEISNSPRGCRPTHRMGAAQRLGGVVAGRWAAAARAQPDSSGSTPLSPPRRGSSSPIAFHATWLS